MTNRERMMTVLAGERPDRIPLAIYGGYIDDASYHVWHPYIERGLCRMPRVTAVREIAPNVEEVVIRERDMRGGYDIERFTLRTPVGELTQIRYNGWIQEYFLKTPRDYRVMEYIVRDTRLEPNFGGCAEWEEKIGDTGITIIRAERSPIQKIIVDYAGLENFSYHIADCPTDVESLLDALAVKIMRYFEILAGCPLKYIQLPENLTSEQVGPERFMQYHMPFYRKIIPMLHGAGKVVFPHYDGKIACLIDLIAQTEIDGIESFTPPPEGDITYRDARAVLPDKVFMAHIGISDYAMPPDDFRNRVIDLIEQAAPDRRNLLFEISEDLPVNWTQSLPLALEVLAEY